MTLLDYLKNVSEHRYEPSLDTFPLFVVNRFFSFSMKPCAVVINNFANYQHWVDVDSEIQQLLLHTMFPKRPYHYGKLFGGYIKKLQIAKDSKIEACVDYVMKYFMINSEEAKAYLQKDDFREAVEKLI